MFKESEINSPVLGAARNACGIIILSCLRLRQASAALTLL
jgi:hypothetical protein